MKKINTLKNMIWALAIMICLAGLLIALLFTAFTHYDGPRERGGVQLGAERSTAEKAPDGLDAGVTPVGKGSALAETEDGGQGYVDGLIFLVDSSLIGLRDYGILPGGVETTQVWSTQTGVVPADSLDDFLIRYPNDGSMISPVDAAMVAKPARLVICLGSDALSTTPEEQFKDGYLRLIENIRGVSPDTKVVLCTLPAVTEDYHGEEGLTAEKLNQAGDWVRDLSAQAGVPYADIGGALNNSFEGTLMSNYASANGKTLNSAGLNVVLHYLRTHTV